MFTIISKIPQVIKKFRLSCGFTQAKVASLLGIDRSTYSYYESGKINPDVRTILNLAKVYGVDYTELLDADAEILCASDVTRNQNSSGDASNVDEYLQHQERSILLGVRMLSRESRDDLLRIISDKIKEEKYRKKDISGWF